MGDSSTVALNLTFFGTVGVALVMFLGLFLLFIATLVLAGVGRLAALIVMALFGRFPKNETIPVVRLQGLPQAQTSHDDGAAAAAALEAAAATEPHRGTPGATAPAAGPRGPRGWSPRDWKKILTPADLKPRLRAAVGNHPLVTAVRREPPVLAQGWAAAVAEADARAMARARAAKPEIRIPVGDLPNPHAPAQDILEVAPLVESATHEDNSVQPIPRSFRKPAEHGPMSMLDTGSLVSLSGHGHITSPDPVDYSALRKTK
ncbi:hypothetical protein V3C33_17705 [Micrococcaceae bacterium Sec5.7]